MKKRIFSTLLALCMLLCLMPTAAFAAESTETPPACSCETACTAESRNAECPVCGAEGADPKNCKCAQPADDAAAQPEGKVSTPQPEGEASDSQPEEEASDPQPEGKASDSQPETALTSLIGGSETPAASGAVTDVSSESELTAAIADTKVNTVKLAGDIIISSSLTVKRAVTLDLNGFVLKYQNDSQRGSVIVVENGGQLTIEDSNTNKLSHRFKLDGKLWVLDETSGTETVLGGVITGGTGTDLSTYGGTTWYCGGGALIKIGGSLTMTGGNIIGCSAECGGGVCVDSGQNDESGQFSMFGGSIAGCVASNIGGGVRASGKFQMSGPAVIRNCTVESTDQSISGGGVYVNNSSEFVMSGEAIIEGCQAISTSAYGGGVYVNSSSSFVMSKKAKIEGCQAISNSNSSKGGGVHLSNNTEFTLSGSAVIQNCKAVNSVNSGETYGGGVSANCMRQITLEGNAQISQCNAANGSGLYIIGSQVAGYGQLFANGGSVEGDVVLANDGPCTITGSGETVFKGKVTVATDSTIEKGTFNGDVINNGTITGGTFTSTVSNNGTITGGTFSGGITGTPALATGSGTKSDPYQIGTADGLKWFRDKVNNATKAADTKICAELTEDIDLSGEEWTPIGIGQSFHWGIRSYSGTFDGKGHTIKNLSIDNSSANFVGLFGYVLGGTIRNLTVSGSVKGSGHTGGIAGGADGGTFENCANLCVVQSDSTEGGTTGGIIGFALNMDYVLIVRDCYNVGSITGRHAGGIIGQCSWHETISNCYNAGTVTGTANVGAIIGRYSSDKISNCYYLEGSVTRAGSGDKMSSSKTAAEFADGTAVLKLLKDGKRDSNADPWADECKYLDAAGKTLPVFNGQGYTHNHQSDKWEHNDTEHWQVCTCGAVFNKAAHSGGKATCKAKAVCEFCKASYGSLDPNSHADLKHIAAKAATAAEEGNIEYWYCEDCDKYFSDAAAAKEITKADTVTAKLPKTTSPQPIVEPRPTAQPQQTAQPQPTAQPVSPIPSTGDTANPALWFALLFVSGGAALGTTIIRKKKQ